MCRRGTWLRSAAFVAVLGMGQGGWTDPPRFRFVPLPLLPGGTSSQAYDINADGRVAGMVRFPAGVTFAVTWAPDGNIRELGIGLAAAINEVGDIGGSGGGTPRPALFWTDAGLPIPVVA